jgi:hypothetical protein
MKIIYDVSTYFHFTALRNSILQMTSFMAKNLASQVCHAWTSIELLAIHYSIVVSRMLNRYIIDRKNKNDVLKLCIHMTT